VYRGRAARQKLRWARRKRAPPLLDAGGSGRQILHFARGTPVAPVPRMASIARGRGVAAADATGAGRLLAVPPPGKRSRVDRVYGEAPAERPRLDARSLAALASILGNAETPLPPELRVTLEAALGDPLPAVPSPEATRTVPAPAVTPAPRIARGSEPPPLAVGEVMPVLETEPAAEPRGEPPPAVPRAIADPHPAADEPRGPLADAPQLAAEKSHHVATADPQHLVAGDPQPAAEKPQPVAADVQRAADEPRSMAGNPQPAAGGPYRLAEPVRLPAQMAAGARNRGRAAPAVYTFFGEIAIEEGAQVGQEGEAAAPSPEDPDGTEPRPAALEDIPAELQVPPGETPEQKKAALESARQEKQAAIGKTTAERSQKVGGAAGAEKAAIQRAGQKKIAGRQAKGKEAGKEAEEAGKFKKLEKARDLSDLKAKLKQRIDEEKEKIKKQAEKDEAELQRQIKIEREKVENEAKTQKKRLDDQIAGKEKDIGVKIKKKGQEAKKRSDTDRKNAKKTTETDKKSAASHAASEARRIEGEANRRAADARARGDKDEAQRIVANGKQSAAEARQKGEEAGRKLDVKLAETLENITRSDLEGAERLEQEKQKMIEEARARARTAEEESKKKITAALVRINEQERTGLEKLKAANEATRKETLRKLDEQMAKVEAGNESDLARIEEDTNKVCAQIHTDIEAYKEKVEADTAKAVGVAAAAADAEVQAIRTEGDKAAAGIDEIANKTSARIDEQAAANEEKTRQVAADGMQAITATATQLCADISAAADEGINDLGLTPEEKQAKQEAKERKQAEAEQAERERVKAAEVAEEMKKKEAEELEATKKEEEQKANKAAADAIIGELGIGKAWYLKKVNVDETRVLDSLRGKTPEQIAAIKAAFKQATAKDLDAALVDSGALDKDELKEAKAHLSGDPVQQAVAVLQNGAAGWTSKEDRQRMADTLAKLDPETRKKVAAEFEKQTCVRLNTMLREEMGDLADSCVVPEEKKAPPKFEGAAAKVDEKAVHAAVAQLRGATTGRLFDTDEKAIREALKGKTPAEIQAIRELWAANNKGGPSLDDVLEKELSGTELKEAKALMSGDPVQKAVATLQNAGDGAGTDVPTMQAQLDELKDPVLREQVAREYEKQTGESLESMIKGELTGRDRDMALAAADGKEDVVAAIKVEQGAKGSYLQDLSDGMADTFGVDRKTMKVATSVAAVVALGPVGTALVIEDMCEDEKKVYSGLEAGKTPEQMAAIEKAYNERNKPNTLRGDLNKQMDGAEKDVVNALLDGNKKKAEAAKLKAAGEGVGAKLGIVERQDIFDGLERCESKQERDELIAEYNNTYGKAAGGVDFDQMVKDGMSELDEKKTALLVKNGKMSDGFAYYYAQNEGYLFGYGPGWGADPDAMKKVTTGKSKKQIEDLNTEYKAVATEFGDKDADIFKDTASETSGREGKELEIALRGEPTTIEEARARAQEMADFERNDVGGTWGEVAMFVVLGPAVYGAAKLAGVSSGDLVRAATDVWAPGAAQDLTASQKRLADKAAEIEKNTPRNEGESDADYQKRKVDLFKQEVDKESGYLKNYQAAKDECADVASTAVGLVVTGAMAIATGGAAAPLCALVGGLCTVATKAAFLGGAYSDQELAMDLANVAAEVVAAGLVKLSALDDAVSGLKALAPDGTVARVLKEAMSEAIENGGSTLLTALVDKRNFKSLDAFARGVLAGPALAAFSGAVAAGATVTLSDVWDLALGRPNSKLGGFMKGGFTEGMGGLAASAVNPDTWQGTPEEIVRRFGKGFIDNVMSAGAEGLGEHIGAVNKHKATARTRDQLACQGITNTTVVGDHVLDMDTGKVYSGDSGAELGTIDVDPHTGMVYDLSRPGEPQPIGVNPHLKGTHIGGMDADEAPAVAAEEPADPVCAGPDSEIDGKADTLRKPMELEPDSASSGVDVHEIIPVGDVDKKPVIAVDGVDQHRIIPVGKQFLAEPVVTGGLSEIDPARRTEGGPTHQLSGNAHDGYHTWQFGCDVTEADGVVKATYRIYLDPWGPISDDALKRFKDNVRKGVELRFNKPRLMVTGPSGTACRLELDVQFTDEPSDAHLQVDLHSGNGDADLTTWYLDGDPTTHAHEIGHGAFGFIDEYKDNKLPNRPVREDGSLMGNFWVYDEHGNIVPAPGTGLRQRHLNQISGLMESKVPDEAMADSVRADSLATPAGPHATDELTIAMNQTHEQRVQALGMSPGGGLDVAQGEVGALIEPELGYLRRESNGGCRWRSLSGPYEGRVFELVAVEAQSGVTSARHVSSQVARHFARPDHFAVIDLRDLEPELAQEVRVFVAAQNPADQALVFLLDASGLEVPVASSEGSPAIATPTVDAVLAAAGVDSESMRHLVRRMGPHAGAMLERLATQSVGDRAAVQGLVGWLQKHLGDTRAKVGKALADRLRDAESELVTVERVLAERPGDTVVDMAGDKAAGKNANGETAQSFDITVKGPGALDRLVEVTRLTRPARDSKPILDKFAHGLKKVEGGVWREIAIEIELDPAAAPDLFEDVARNLHAVDVNGKLHRCVLFDRSGAVLADIRREGDTWTVVESVAIPGDNAPRQGSDR
jgi:hypothetical protein